MRGRLRRFGVPTLSQKLIDVRQVRANAELRATDLLDISAEDANRLNFHNGERVRVHSAYGEAVLPIRITSSVKPGELFATFHTAEVFLNRVTSPYRDRYVKTPEYKITAVRIERQEVLEGEP